MSIPTIHTKDGRRYAELIFVAPGGVRGNNKIYKMHDNGNGTFTVQWGRVGLSLSETTYSSGDWEKKYREKTKKGYKDVTEHFINEDAAPGQDSATQLAKDFYGNRPQAIVEIAKRLQMYANKSVQQNYTVSVANVSQKQVDAAQAALDVIATESFDQSKVKKINDTLIELYHIIPRRMAVVGDHVLNPGASAHDNEERFREIVKNEQDTLDVMAGQVKTMAARKTKTDDADKADAGSSSPVDLIEAAGLDIVEITQAEIDIIKRNMQGKAKMFKRAFKVVNKVTQARYDAHMAKAANKKAELFWHGSRTENWWSIMTKGLLIRPSSAVYTGSMFGDGVYFASEFDKSLGYTSISGSRWASGGQNFAFLALYNVHLGKQYMTETSDSSLSARKLKDKGDYDSTWGKKGRSLFRDEYIVYNSDQSTIAYLVEVEGSQW